MIKRTLIISYDLHSPGQNYNALINKIKSFGFWAKLGESAYLINTEETVAEVRDYLKAVLDSNDSLFVGVSPPPAAWYGLPNEVANWLLNNQK